MTDETIFEKEFAKLPHDGKWRELNIIEKAWVKDGKVYNHYIKSFVLEKNPPEESANS